MSYADLRELISALERCGELKRIQHTVDPYLEMTEVCDRTLRRGGPALLFENPRGYSTPVLGNLFGTQQRVAQGMGAADASALREIGELLAFLRQPEPPQGMRDAWDQLPVFRKVMDMTPRKVRRAPCQESILEDGAVDLADWPIQTCWPGDAAPLITWALVITRGPNKERQNLGIYRQQVIGRNRVIMRWLAHRGGALDFADWQCARPGKPFPVAVALGTDPATMLAAVTPVPDALSEYAFAGLLRGAKSEVVDCKGVPLQVPASAEIVFEGHIHPEDTAEEGPFADHTGYYNEVERFPVLTIERITHRRKPIYHSTYTGRPPDEPAVLGEALNEVFVPILRKQFPEVTDFYLPPEGCSYRLAIVTMRKNYPGHAKRVMLGVWSFLRQFMYTKFVIVTDEDINARDWQDVIWALTTRCDPYRDSTFIEHSPIDYLDFASPVSGLGSKLGIDATHKLPGETARQWGSPVAMDEGTKHRVDEYWHELGLD